MASSKLPALVYGLSWSAFPLSLDCELEAYLERRADPEALLKWSCQTLSETSIVRLRLHVRECAAALVHQGIPIATISSLGFLAKPQHLKTAVRYILGRSGRERSSMACNAASAICGIARHWANASEEDLATMTRLRRLVELARYAGQRSARRVLPIAEQRKIRALLMLPDRMMSEARSYKGRKEAVKAAVIAQTALAIELLMLCPMRPWSLRNVQIERHILVEDTGHGLRRYLEPPSLPSQRLESVRYELSPKTFKILQEYLSLHHAHLTSSPSPFLFVARGGDKPRTYGGFHKAVRDAIRQRLRLEMSPSDLRFFAGALHLRQWPGRIELVSRLLGHRSTVHTLRSYSDILAVPLMARYQRMVIE